MTPADLQKWMETLHLNRKDAGQVLGCTQDMIRSMLNPDRAKPIPRYIALACAAVSYRLPPWR